MAEAPAPSGQDHANVLVMPPALYGGAVLLGVVARWIFGGRIAPESGLRLAVGAALLALGVGLALWFSRIFQAMGQDRSPRTPTPALVTDGLYAWTRNPAYLGLSCIQLGLGLLLDNPWIVGLLIPVVLVMQFGVIFREEAYLARRFGDEYLRYKGRVRRWL